MLGWKVGDGFEMLPGNQQAMSWKKRAVIEKGQHPRVVEDDGRRYLSGCDLAK